MTGPSPAAEPEKVVSVSSEPAVAAPEPEVDPEDASDAQLRTWAKDNGIEDVPANGKLSAAWREQITAAMAGALAVDPKAEVTAEATTEPSTLKETTTEKAGTSTTGEETTPPTEPEPAPYRTPWVAPHTWVTGQSFTA